MKNKKLDPERARIQNMAAALHAINMRKGYYRDEAKVHHWGVTEPSRGPRFYRAMRRQSYEGTGLCSVFYMDSPNNHVVMINTGHMALWQETLNRFEQFDFASGSEMDFRIIKDAVDKWGFLLQHKKP